MNYYFAPMEGITGYIHRNAHHKLFPGTDKYITAFIAPNQYGKLSSKEQNDILPEHNEGIYTVPQMLTNCARDFITTTQKIKEFGYQEVNLNLGCPSKTVTSKQRGAGFLAVPERLDRFLDEIFNGTDVEISIKTRIGVEEPEEFYRLLEIFNKYPVKELIIHPRTQRDFYKNTPDWEMFREAYRLSHNKICYNGDLFTISDYERFTGIFPEVDTVMLGRGLLMNPGLICELQNLTIVTKEELRAFHDYIYQGYQQILSGEKPVLCKMKELWTYMIQLFTDPKRNGKRIKKAEHLNSYDHAVQELFSNQQFLRQKAALVMEPVSTSQ